MHVIKEGGAGNVHARVKFTTNLAFLITHADYVIDPRS